MNTAKLKEDHACACAKKELALMYFPESSPQAAVKHLMAWIKRCDDLMESLHQAGYDHRAKHFTPRQTALIVRYLGMP